MADQKLGVRAFQQGRVSLRLFLVVPFVLQVTIAVGLTGYLSLRNGEMAVNKLAIELQKSVSDRVSTHITNYLGVPRHLTELNADVLQNELLVSRDYARIGRLFWQQIQSFRTSYMFIGYTNGDYMAVGSAPPDDFTYYFEQSKPTSPGKLARHRINATGKWDPDKPDEVIDYNYKAEYWYFKTLETKKPMWSEIYAWDSDPNVLAASVTHPIFDANGQLFAIIGVDNRLQQISGFLSSLDKTQAGRIFIIERSGLLVASSSQEYSNIDRGRAKRLGISESKAPLIQATAKYLQSQFSDLGKIDSKYNTGFSQDGQSFFLQVTPFQDKWGLDWLIVVVSPTDDFIAEINANTQTTIWLCLVAFGVAITLSFYTSHWIAKPILHLAKSATALSQGNLDQEAPKSSIVELNILGRAFDQMATQLKLAFGNLEHRVKERTNELSSTLNQLKTTQAQLIHAEKMSSLGQLVAGIAHEINNPISFIRGNIHYAKDYVDSLLKVLSIYERHLPEPPPEVAELAEEVDLAFLRHDLPKSLDSMESGTERVRQVVLSLRGFIHLDESELKSVNIHNGLDNTLTVLSSRLNLHKVQVIKDYGELVSVECYPGHLNQVFLNIISNALDVFEEYPNYSESNYLTIRTQQLNQDWVQVAISNSGPIIPEEIRSKIFDAFFSTKDVGKGTGLGLYISYQVIVNQHRGSLRCECDQMTTFIIEIPVKQSNISSNSEEVST